MTKVGRGDHILKISDCEYYAVVDGVEHGAWISRALALGGMKVEQLRKAERLAKLKEANK